jgi:hypothetical protein
MTTSPGSGYGHELQVYHEGEDGGGGGEGVGQWRLPAA